MWNPEGESDRSPLRPCFDRRLKLEFHGSRVTSDAGLLAYRELDDALGLTALAGDVLADSRTGKNGWHGVVGLLRQSVYGRLAGYEDVNDAERLGRDAAMRWIVGGKAVERGGASTSQMGRFETELLANDENLAALADLSGVWIDRVHARKLPRMIVLDMDSSVSPTHGDQEGTAYNGHFGCTCYHPLFVFNQFGDLERCALRPGNVHSAHGWRDVLVPVVERYKERAIRLYFRGDAAFASPEIYDYLEAEGMLYAIRLPANKVLQESIAHLLKRPVGKERRRQRLRRLHRDLRRQIRQGGRLPGQGSRDDAGVLRLSRRALEASAHHQPHRKHIRHRATPYRAIQGMPSNKTALAMVFKLAQTAQNSWRRLDGHNQLPKLIVGVKFIDGTEAVRQQPQAAA